MPYTEDDDRHPYEKLLEPIFKFMDAYQISEGDFNYFITRITLKYFLTQKRYSTACKIEGVLNHITKEFYARVVRAYEDFKIDMNGDVPEYVELIKWIKESKAEYATNKSKQKRTTRKIKSKSSQPRRPVSKSPRRLQTTRDRRA